MQIFLLWILFFQFYFFLFLIFILYCQIISTNKIHDYNLILIIIVLLLLLLLLLVLNFWKIIQFLKILIYFYKIHYDSLKNSHYTCTISEMLFR